MTTLHLILLSCAPTAKSPPPAASIAHHAVPLDAEACRFLRWRLSELQLELRARRGPEAELILLIEADAVEPWVPDVFSLAPWDGGLAQVSAQCVAGLDFVTVAPRAALRESVCGWKRAGGSWEEGRSVVEPGRVEVDGERVVLAWTSYSGGAYASYDEALYQVDGEGYRLITQEHMDVPEGALGVLACEDAGPMEP